MLAVRTTTIHLFFCDFLGLSKNTTVLSDLNGTSHLLTFVKKNKIRFILFHHLNRQKNLFIDPEHYGMNYTDTTDPFMADI